LNDIIVNASKILEEIVGVRGVIKVRSTISSADEVKGQGSALSVR
jgi:hypothetical protein